ncbi:MAG: phosphate ABC transporter permease subunit PstC [Euryarchaeota archaeon]|nr:phosphate ABC transporter permease subunit PstC [Euryarchaeota archaeon]
MSGSACLAALAVLALAALLLLVLIRDSWSAISTFGAGFLLSTEWNPVAGRFGALPFIYGTLVSSLLALAIGVPLSLGIAVYLTEIASPRVRAILTPVIELLAAIPSVIIGLWGIFVLAPFVREHLAEPLMEHLGFLPLFKGPAYGYSVLTASLVLAIMIIPIISSISREAILAVPRLQKEGALALGATRFEMITSVVLPYARGAIFGAIMLGLGRAIGETMAVTMVIGNTPKLFTSLLHPGYTMAAVIANEFTEATGDLYLSALIEIGLILFIISMLVNVLARLVIRHVRVPGGA